MVLRTAKEVANHLEIGYSTVRYYCNRYGIGTKVGDPKSGTWVLDEHDIEAIRSRMREDPIEEEA